MTLFFLYCMLFSATMAVYYRFSKWGDDFEKLACGFVCGLFWPIAIPVAGFFFGTNKVLDKITKV